MRTIKTFFKVILIVLVITLIALIVAFFYAKRHPEVVLSSVLQSINEKQNGHLQIGTTELSDLRKLPSLSLILRNVVQTDTGKAKNSCLIFRVEQVDVDLDLTSAFSQKIIVERVKIQRAEIQIDKNTSESKEPFNGPASYSFNFKDIDEYIPVEGLVISITDSRFHFKDPAKSKEFILDLNQLDAQAKSREGLIQGQITFAMKAKEVAFNQKNGSFFNGAVLSGAVAPKINLETDEYSIPPFALNVDDQVFMTDVSINLTDSTDFYLTLENPQTDFAKTRGLLTKKIQSKLISYEFDRRFYTKSSISGSFAPGSQPFVIVDFNMTDNFATINDTIAFKNLTLAGSFQNRLSTNPLDHRNSELKFNTFNAKYFGSQVYLYDSYLTSTPQVPTFINFKLKANGSSTSLNQILDNKDFLFRDKAPYTFQASFSGSITDPKEILNAAESQLQIGKTSILYAPTNLLVNTDTIAMAVSKEHALLESLVLSLQSGHKAHFNGDIRHFTSLVFEAEDEEVTALLSLESEILDINDFLNSVNELNKGAKNKAKGTLSATLQGIYNDFHPTVSIDIDSLYFRDTLTTGFYTGLRFNAANILEFEDLTFSFQGNPVNISGSIEVPEFFPETQFEEEVILDLAMQSKGKSSVFNSLFQNENFIFLEGNYEFDGKLNGNIRDSDQITSTATGSLTFDDVEMLYNPKKIQFPIKTIDLDLKNTNAYLNSLKVPFASGDQVNIFGEVTNFTSLLSDSSAKVVTNLTLNSETLNYLDLLAAFEVLGPESGGQDSAKTQIREAAKLLGRQFSPTVNLDVANFQYKRLDADGLQSKLTFDENDNFNLNETGFRFSNGHVQLNAKLDLSEKQNAPFDIDFDATKVDLSELLQTFDFFGLQSIRDIKQLDGVVSISSNLDLVIREDNSFDLSTLTGNVKFDIQNLELGGFEPLTKIGQKIKAGRRVENIKFAPIQDSLFISRKTAYIPRLVIQSTGFDFFIEGQFSYEDKTNLWVSIPLSNLKKRDLTVIPDRIDYNEAGKKVFVHIFGKGPKDLTYQFHLSDRKLYADKGLLPFRKTMKQAERKERRASRRNRKETSD